jgi:superfamily II DNA or RNA helicase
VIDEAHHAAANTYKRVLGYFGPRFVLGLTATPDQADGQSIRDLTGLCPPLSLSVWKLALDLDRYNNH